MKWLYVALAGLVFAARKFDQRFADRRVPTLRREGEEPGPFGAQAKGAPQEPAGCEMLWAEKTALPEAFPPGLADARDSRILDALDNRAPQRRAGLEDKTGGLPRPAVSQLLLPKPNPLPKLPPPAPTRAARHPFVDLLDRVAALDTDVLITGPAGAGKARYAQYLHQRGHRADRALVPVFCAEGPLDWIESELFGHGDAQRQNPGLIAEAEGGTLFLDEVDQLPLGIQVKLLRFLQEKEYRRLGGNRFEQANVRIVAATKADPTGAEGEKRFFQEFLCRLRVTAVEVPALAGRREDIPFLLAAFATAYAEAYHLPCLAFGDGALEKLCTYSWPGDLRELENCVKYLTCLQLARPVEACDLPLLADGEPKNPPEFKMLAEAGKIKPVNLELLRLFERVDH